MVCDYCTDVRIVEMSKEWYVHKQHFSQYRKKVLKMENTHKILKNENNATEYPIIKIF